MERATVYTEKKEYIRTAAKVVLGCLLMTLCSFVKIPLYPISFTLHTFAVALLGMTQRPKEAFASVMLYLLCGSVGLPVFAGHANPLWLAGKAAGYYVSFPIVAYLIAKMREKISPIAALAIGNALTLLMGGFWLAPLLGLKVAILNGMLIFVPSELLKILAVLSFVSWKKRVFAH